MTDWKRRDQRRRERDENFEREQRELQEKRESCTHDNCTVTRSYWSGRPAEVCCQDCDSTNYLEDE